MNALKHLSLAAGITFLASGTFGQPIVDYDAMPTPIEAVTTDLDADGAPEVVSAYTLNDRYEIVTIRPAGSGGDRDFDAAFVVPINQSDSETLQVLPNGNLRISWGCFACGRYHSQSSVVIDARDGNLVVIGFDDSYADRIFAAVITCSVNLLTGDAIVEAVGVDRQTFTTNDRPYDLIHLSDQRLPQACRSGYARYDDAFLTKHYPQD